MTRWIAMIGSALLLAGVAAADPASIPTIDDGAHWASIEQEVDAELQREIDLRLERALRHHTATAEAMRDVGDCDPVRFAAATRGLSATERHHRLTACLAQRRVTEGLVAAKPDAN